jgi:cAMP phosphodiesterase
MFALLQIELKRLKSFVRRALKNMRVLNGLVKHRKVKPSQEQEERV